MGWRVDCFVLYLYGRSQQDRIKNKLYTIGAYNLTTRSMQIYHVSVLQRHRSIDRSLKRREKKMGKKTKNGNLVIFVEKPKQKHVGHRLSSFHNIQIV